MPSSFQNLINRTIKVEPREIPSAASSFLFAFSLMAAYYVLRPVRDAMSSDWTDAELSWLWTLNFFISAAAVLLYGFVVSRIELKKLVPGIYIFFAASFLLFYLATLGLSDTGFIDKSFYVWVSFFALFHISVFWSFMSDIYSKAQSLRLFGLFGAGASIGAVVGPSLPVLLGEAIGVYNLLLIAALMLLLIVPIIFYLDKHRSMSASGGAGNEADPVSLKSIGGDFFGGFVDFLSHRFLLGIGLFILLYTMMSTFVYFELKNVMVEYDRATRAQYWGMMDLIVNSLAIVTALFATSRLATNFGLAITLALVPIIMVFGWIAVAVAPGLALLVALQIVRRAGNYAITRPGREMLFTGSNAKPALKPSRLSISSSIVAATSLPGGPIPGWRRASGWAWARLQRLRPRWHYCGHWSRSSSAISTGKRVAA